MPCISVGCQGRFIPADAGNTFGPDVTEMDNDGLSPLTRGTRKPGQRHSGPLRFIPAGAGNTQLLSLDRCVPAVYPRWRGEHLNLSHGIPAQYGLSPLARGTRDNHR